MIRGKDTDMPRFEVTGTATDVYTLSEIMEALKTVGARNINRRNAFGWRNQPHVATFEADDEQEADFLCTKAREALGPGSLPALLPHIYS